MRPFFLPLAVLILLVAAFLRLWQLHLYPPGPHYDEAVYLLITRSIAFSGARPFPIVEAYQGREVLYMYLNAPLLHLLGDSVFTMRLASAFDNLIAIAVSMALGRAMFRGARGIIIGLLVGVLMALSFPQLVIARQGFRAVTLPLCQSLALLSLWRGLNRRRGGWGWLAAGGLVAGLALYTYMASRLFPFWLLVAGLALLVIDRGDRPRRFRQGLVFFGLLALTAAPMGLYALRRPDIFWGRLAEVTRPEDSITLGESILLHARMFFVEGDPYLRYNIPGRPYLTWPEGLLLLVGAAVALFRLLRPGRPTERVACLLALLSPLMVIPSVVSVGGLPPSHMRSLGMIPLIFFLPAIGAEGLVARLARVVDRRPAWTPRLAAAGIAALALLGGAALARTYTAWAGRADLYYESDADLSAAAQWLPGHVDDRTLVYVAARDRGHPTVTIEQVPPITWLGTDSFFRPPLGFDGLYIFPRSAPPPPDWLSWLEPGRLTDLPLGPDGRTAFEAFRLSATTPLPTAVPPPGVVRSPYLALVGARPVTLAAGARGAVELTWEIRAAPPYPDLTPLLQLEDASGFVLDRQEAYVTETDRWRPGEVWIHRLPLHVPDATPPGSYPLRVAWVARTTDTYVPYESGAIWATVGALDVITPADFPDAAALPVQVRHALEAAPGVHLLGWNPPPAEARPGESLPVTFFWQAGPAPGSRPDVVLDLRLRGDGGDTVLLQTEPVAGYPSSRWRDGELLAGRLRLPIPRQQPPGDYMLTLSVGPQTVDIGSLRVAGLAREFDPPLVEERVDAHLGDSLRLYGATLEASGRDLTVDLVWNAVQPVAEDYKVFVHLLDDTGAIVAQRDAMPRDNTYPTSLWIAGEYVRDSYHFADLPPGQYRVAVGLYSPSTGARLPAISDRRPVDGDAIQLGELKVQS